MARPRAIIVGGGFAGAFTARYLHKYARGAVDIELFNTENYFVFQPLLPEVASGTISAPDAVTPLRYMLPGVRIRMAEVTHLD
ncbi:MAG: nucleotide-disulfide oxidoreductase, partial [Proteobacteria bacterium]|nr:nucleotide-disulfide oxidoreductase [Pseudomonadota bacterium]